MLWITVLHYWRYYQKNRCDFCGPRCMRMYFVADSHVPKLSAHASNDRLTQTANSWATAVDFSTSGVVSLPQPLPPTSGSGRQTLRVHETAINYSMPRRTASAADGLSKTGNGIPTLKRPRPDADDDSDGRYMSRDRVCSTIGFSKILTLLLRWV